MISIRTLASHSAQEVFDHLAHHLMTMPQRCTQANGIVGALHFGDFRSPGGSLIIDADYLLSMEGLSWRSLAHKGLVPEAHRDLIDEIEYIHDSYGEGNWHNRLAEVAQRHGLSCDIKGVALAA